MPSLSVEQIDQQIQALKARHEKDVAELLAARAAILKYGRNGAPKVAPNSTGLKDAVVGLSLPFEFKVSDVVRLLREKHFNFGGREPNAAVRDCLYILAEKEIFRVKEKGTGGRESVYETVA